jgi:anti-sigma B factor antagonist
MNKIHKEILGLMGKIDIDCWDEGDLIVIDLKGQLDIYNSNDLNKLIEAYRQRGFHKFAVNLEDVTYLDSSTISVFIHCFQTLEKSQGKFLIAGLQGVPKEIFEMAKLHDVFELYPDITSAIKSQISDSDAD